MADDMPSMEQNILVKAQGWEGPLLPAGALKQAEYVGAVLDSSLGRWLLARAGNVPIPKLSAAEQRPFIRLAEQVRKAKAANPNADTAPLEAEIDRLVYALYGLTDAETAAVEGKLSALKTAAEGVDKPRFKVVPLAGGFAPGVNPDNLKDILYEMDVEDYLEEEKREEVEKLADEWEKTRPRGVDVTTMAEHPAYLRIIEIGKPAVPWLLARLEQRPNHWFLALSAITEADPVPLEGQGNLKAMSEAWLKWGRENGYRW